MTSLAIAALSGVMVLSVVIFGLGRRYLRGYQERYHANPPSFWMFTRAEDPELERLRRTALLLLPFYAVAAIVYLFRP